MLGSLELNRIYAMDCVDGMLLLPENSIDLTVTSPPYNLGIDYVVYKDNLPISEYRNFIVSVFSEIYRITKKGGRVCINVPPDIGTLKENDKIALDHLYHGILEEVGFKYRTKIVWHKNQITSRTAWGSFQSPSNPNLLPPFEYVLVYYKDSPKKEGDKSNIDIEKDEFIRLINALWEIKPESAKKIGHPAPYPVELVKNLIKIFSYKYDTIIDPFMGSGTTAVAAISANRNFIGFELNNDYIEIANKRIKEALTNV